MAPRKNRGESSNAMAPIPGYEDFHFTDTEQQDRILATISRNSFDLLEDRGEEEEEEEKKRKKRKKRRRKRGKKMEHRRS
ncbi:unnamed protein product [Cuscuta epithymum]|uniref:Uncharacterized protein n=1 Tax=Cuscuta epithymum TaxID=186058 RepID=A0AAV0F6W4_9ASTE|nr:unnamed protein product [Cuscuta epithymum]CAH9131138.1 unnamed protein product [Cuscuta epithymum]